jgi:hypothetical protein
MSIMAHKSTFRQIIFSLVPLLMVLSITSCSLIVMNLLAGPETSSMKMQVFNWQCSCQFQIES